MLGLDFVMGLMASEPNIIIFFGLFFVFILLAYKVVKVLLRALVVAVIAGLFPVFANMFLGFSFDITLPTIIRFAMMGAEMYFIYHILVSIGKIAEFVTKPFRGKKVKKVEKVLIVEKGKDKHGKEKED
jgi:hypothetical protein